jgi:hypothetical protein
MKYVLAILLFSLMLLSACSSSEGVDDTVIIDDSTEDNVADNLDDGEVLPELINPDEDVEIGEMI